LNNRTILASAKGATAGTKLRVGNGMVLGVG